MPEVWQEAAVRTTMFRLKHLPAIRRRGRSCGVGKPLWKQENRSCPQAHGHTRQEKTGKLSVPGGGCSVGARHCETSEHGPVYVDCTWEAASDKAAGESAGSGNG